MSTTTNHQLTAADRIALDMLKGFVMTAAGIAFVFILYWSGIWASMIWITLVG